MATYTSTPVYAAPIAEGTRFSVGSATAFAVRREEKDIALRIRRERRPFRQMMSRVPFARGMQRLWLSTVGLLDGISESAELSPQRIARGTRGERALARLFRTRRQSLIALGSAILIPLILLSLIFGLPLALERFALSRMDMSRRFVNAAMWLARVIGLWLGLYLCGQLRVVRRLLMYRGAINKVLNAYENEHREPTLNACMEASRVYHRSDMAFLMIVLAVSMAVFAQIRTFTLPIQLLVRLLTMFVVAGIVNEPIQALEGLKPTHPLSKLFAPCVWLERMFVIEPNAQMVEVALCAFNAARENDM